MPNKEIIFKACFSKGLEMLLHEKAIMSLIKWKQRILAKEKSSLNAGRRGDMVGSRFLL